ncbi:MAG: DUF2330 domain-containing protein [Planctomycetota bacterium]
MGRTTPIAAWGVVALSLGHVALAHADMGSIPFRPGVEIFEPSQRALLAWDGCEEILLLATDLRASEPTKVLEVIPLPAEPQVSKGDVEAFARAVEIINQSQREKAEALSHGIAAANGRPAGEVTQQKRIGAHDIAVTRVIDRAGFVEWVKHYLAERGADEPTIPEPLEAVVTEYLQEGYQWFVFDVVELGLEIASKDAILFRFKSQYVYYPLKITRAESGTTQIELIIVTPKLLTRCHGIPRSKITVPHDPVWITPEQLTGISKEMRALLGTRSSYPLRIWRIAGKLSGFTEDLIVD